MASPNVTHFQDLPLEILTLVCTHLCHHCFSYDISLWKPSCEPEGMSDEERNACRVGLTSLAAASRRLRNVARPILWHRIEPSRSGPDSKDEMIFYIRFLQSNLDLKSAVRSLVINGKDERCTCCRHWEDDLDSEERRTVRKAAKETGLPIMMGGFTFDNCVETLVQTLISLLPALADLHLSIPQAWAFDSLQVWRYKGLRLDEAPRRFLRNAKRIEIEVDGPEHAKCCPGHNECVVPTHVSQAEQILVESAPFLEVLSCTAGGLDGLPFLPRLKYLELQPKGMWNQIFSLFDRLPGLTHLRYCTANEHSPTPRMLQHALDPLVETLEYLSVSVQRFITRPSFGSYDEWEPPSTEDWTLESLKSFTSLKQLTIDAGMIWRGRGKGGQRVFEPRDRNKMAHFLPASMEEVFIDDLYGDMGPLFPLAQSVTNGYYPNLQVMLWYEVERSGEVTMTLDKKDESDWLVNDNWKSHVCGSEDWAHIRTSHTLSDGHLLAFPDWKELYQEHRRRHHLLN